MSVHDDVLEAINEVLDICKTPTVVTDDTCLPDIMDSMSVLEVLLVLEEKGYDINDVRVDEIGTVSSLVETMSERK